LTSASAPNMLVHSMIGDIAIVGAGPAGAYLGYRLARKGIYAAIYDDSHPREKPCGGGLTPFAQRRFPILEGIPSSARRVDGMLFVSPKGREALVPVPSLANVSREVLDGYLLEKAVEAGASLVEERVIAVEGDSGSWLVRTRNGTRRFGLVVGADGTASVIRRATIGPIPREDLAAGIGCYARGVEMEYSVMRFLKGFRGYAWVFPRETHSSIGIGLDARGARGLPALLNEFIDRFCPDIERLSSFGAMIPAPRNHRFYRLPCAGASWILIGDAAGHVDPLLGEGIRYALWDAELAAEAIAAENPASFDTLWRQAYYQDLVKARGLVKLAYNPVMLEFIVMMAARSPTFRRIMAGVVTRDRPYVGLKRRAAASLPRIMAESAAASSARKGHPG
jgi:geranylgeranyl reductase family protein